MDTQHSLSTSFNHRIPTTITVSFDADMLSAPGTTMSMDGNMSPPGTPMHCSDADVLSATCTPMHCSDTASDGINDLAQVLRSTNLDGKREGQWAFLSPGMTRDEQLRVISGDQSASSPQKPAEEMETGESQEGGDKITVAQAMDNHLALLAAHSPSTGSNHIAATTLVAARSLLTLPSTPKSALELLKGEYRDALRTGTSPTALACAPLPMQPQELESLSIFMADE